MAIFSPRKTNLFVINYSYTVHRASRQMKHLVSQKLFDRYRLKSVLPLLQVLDPILHFISKKLVNLLATLVLVILLVSVLLIGVIVYTQLSVLIGATAVSFPIVRQENLKVVARAGLNDLVGHIFL